LEALLSETRTVLAGPSAVFSGPVIKSFADKTTAALFAGHRVRSLPPDIHRRAYVKLQVLDAADSLDFLRLPPSNRLEPLRGEREGQWSIRINDQWRICFRWEGSDAQDVEITDYH
jgi:proteic killer suppression protein